MAAFRPLLLACGLLLAGCADQTGVSKFASPIGKPPIWAARSAEAKVNPDGTVVERSSTSARVRRHASRRDGPNKGDNVEESRDGQGVGSAAEGAKARRRAIIARGSSNGSVPATDTTYFVHAKQGVQTPVIGSDEWQREEAENARLEKLLDDRIKKSICSRC